MKSIPSFSCTLTILLIGSLSSCYDNSTFNVIPDSINSYAYSAGGTLTFLYSIDGGSTFTPEIPKALKVGATVLVKLNNGKFDLKSDDFRLDWSGSIPAPKNIIADVAEIKVVGGNILIKVFVEDNYSLVAGNSSDGKFYVLNPNGIEYFKVNEFKFVYNGETLTGIRAFVYHARMKLFYASTNSGQLFSIDPESKIASRINENKGSDGSTIWNSVDNWAVASDDSLISVGNFKDDGNGIVKFGTDGRRSRKTIHSNICCGMGIIYDSRTNDFIIQNGKNDGVGMTSLETLSGSTGLLTKIVTITNYWEISTQGNNYLKALARLGGEGGIIYGILYSTFTKESYLVVVTGIYGGLSIRKIALLGAKEEEYYNLTYIPNYAL
jgi:hypothetical protein